MKTSRIPSSLPGFQMMYLSDIRMRDGSQYNFQGGGAWWVGCVASKGYISETRRTTNEKEIRIVENLLARMGL